jgi:hypothetical protein
MVRIEVAVMREAPGFFGNFPPFGNFAACVVIFGYVPNSMVTDSDHVGT